MPRVLSTLAVIMPGDDGQDHQQPHPQRFESLSDPHTSNSKRFAQGSHTCYTFAQAHHDTLVRQESEKFRWTTPPRPRINPTTIKAGVATILIHRTSCYSNKHMKRSRRSRGARWLDLPEVCLPGDLFNRRVRHDHVFQERRTRLSTLAEPVNGCWIRVIDPRRTN